MFLTKPLVSKQRAEYLPRYLTREFISRKICKAPGVFYYNEMTLMEGRAPDYVYEFRIAITVQYAITKCDDLKSYLENLGYNVYNKVSNENCSIMCGNNNTIQYFVI